MRYSKAPIKYDVDDQLFFYACYRSRSGHQYEDYREFKVHQVEKAWGLLTTRAQLPRGPDLYCYYFSRGGSGLTSMLGERNCIKQSKTPRSLPPLTLRNAP